MSTKVFSVYYLIFHSVLLLLLFSNWRSVGMTTQHTSADKTSKTQPIHLLKISFVRLCVNELDKVQMRSQTGSICRSHLLAQRCSCWELFSYPWGSLCGGYRRESEDSCKTLGVSAEVRGIIPFSVVFDVPGTGKRQSYLPPIIRATSSNRGP